MALPMARPYRHPKTGIYWLRKVVPMPLRAAVGQGELKASLHTRDATEAKSASRAVADRFDAILASARAKLDGTTASLTLREITAAVGVAYRLEAGRWADDPGEAAHWDQAAEVWGSYFQPDDDDEHGPRRFVADTVILGIADDLLRAQGILADRRSVRLAAEVWAREQANFARQMSRRCEGDWRASTGAERFPEARPAAMAAPEPPPVVPLADLLHGWATETRKTGKALYDRQRTALSFTNFLGHTDAAKVTADDVVAWKESRLNAGRSLKTVANDINELSPIWKWAKRNRKLTFAENPFAGLAPLAKASEPARGPYTADEAGRLLQAAREQTGFLRWVPWLLAYTGARVGELCQSDKADIVPIEGMAGWWALHIHRKGPTRTLKTPQSQRFVPLHPALVAEGFMAYVASLPAGSPLFPTVGLDKFGSRRGRGSNLHAQWVRGTVKITEKFKDPAHAWRHLFEDRARRAGVPQNATDALLGHKNAANEAEGYGRGFKFMADATAPYVAKMDAVALPAARPQPAS